MSCAPSYDKTVERDLKRYDSALEIRWNGRIDCWELWRKGKTNYSLVVQVKNDDSSYRPVDRRLFSFIINNDCWKFKSPREAYFRMLDWDKRDREYKDAQLYNQFNDITREKAHWMNRSAPQSGKGDNERQMNKNIYRSNYDEVFREKTG